MRVQSLNVLRIGLIFTIFLCHSNDFLPERIGYYAGTLTGYALQLFFMISGFCCILSAFNKPPQKTLSYFWHRVKKVYPMHFIAYLAMLFLILCGYYQLTTGQIVLQSFLTLTFLQAWIPNEDLIYSINGVAWFLSALMFCYLLTPLLTHALKKCAPYALWGAIALPLIQLAYVAVFNYWGFEGGMCFTNVAPPFRFLEYATGACLAVVYLRRREQGELLHSSFVQVAALVIYLVLLYGTKNDVGYTRYFVFANIFLMCSWVFVDGVITNIGSNGIVARMAAEIMPFYLMHSVFIKAVRLFIHTPVFDERPLFSLGLWICILLVTIAFSRLYYVVEGAVKKHLAARCQAAPTRRK